MTRFTIAALAAAMLAGGPAFAQSIPEGQSCGGLLCDMGVFGQKTEPKPPAPPAPVHAEAAPPTVAAEPADLEPKPKAVRKKKRVAKAAPKEKVLDKAQDKANDTPTSEAKAVPAPAAKVAKRPNSVVQAPVPFGWQTAVTLPVPAEPAAAPAERPPAPAKTPVAQAKPQPANGSMPVNVINLYSSLPSTTNIRPLY